MGDGFYQEWNKQEKSGMLPPGGIPFYVRNP